MITVTAVIAASAVSQRGTISAPILRLPAVNMTRGTMAKGTMGGPVAFFIELAWAVDGRASHLWSMMQWQSIRGRLRACSQLRKSRPVNSPSVIRYRIVSPCVMDRLSRSLSRAASGGRCGKVVILFDAISKPKMKIRLTTSLVSGIPLQLVATRPRTAQEKG